MEKRDRITYLFSTYLAQKASPVEREELFQCLQDSANDELFKGLIDASWERDSVLHKQDEVKADAIFTAIVSHKQPAKLRSFSLWRYVAAASIILTLSVGAYFLLSKKEDHSFVAQQPVEVEDIPAPSSTHATLTLADGRKILLDSAGNGVLAAEGNVKLLKTADGGLVYEGRGSTAVFNTLNNPRGSKVLPVVLSDGTKVWLNSESSLYYPASFSGGERRVQVTGEAYFEVAPNLGKPFVVAKEDVAVTVLGTHFNVNAYEDENDLKITLLEGKVKVSKQGQAKLLAVGQQAQVKKDGTIALNTAADLDVVMAWKNGSFSFRNATLPVVLRQLARWYNVDVRFEGKIPDRQFNGEIGRDLTLKQVLEGLQFTNVSFRIEGNKLTILP